MKYIKAVQVDTSIVGAYIPNKEDALDVAVAKFVSKTGILEIERLQQGRYTLNG